MDNNTDKKNLLDDNKQILFLILGLISIYIIIFSPIVDYIGDFSLRFTDNLIKINVFFALIIFILYFYFIIINFNTIFDFFKDVKKITWIIIFILMIISVIFNFHISQHFMRIQDEFIYIFSARQIINTGTQDVVGRGIGWPLVISFLFFILGDVGIYAYYFSSFLAVLSVFISFLLFYTISKNEIISLLSSLFFSLSPLVIIYSSWAETNFPSLFFFLLSLLFFFLYVKIKEINLLLLLTVSLSFFLTFRGENYLFLVPILFGLFLYNFNFKLLLNKKLILFLIIIFSLSLPQFLLFSRVYFTQNFAETQYDATGGDNISFENFSYNFKNYVSYLFNGVSYPIFFILFLILGLIFSFIYFRKEFFFLIFYFFFILFTMFLWWIGPNPGSFPPQLRYVLVLIPIISFFMACGIYFLVFKIAKSNYIKSKFNFNFNSLLFFVFIIFIFLFLTNSIDGILDYNTGELYSIINKLTIDLGHIISSDPSTKNCTLISINNYNGKFLQTTQLFYDHNDTSLSPHFKKEFKESECLLLTYSPQCDFLNSDFFKYKCDYFRNNFNKTVFKYYEIEGIYFPLYKLERN